MKKHFIIIILFTLFTVTFNVYTAFATNGFAPVGFGQKSIGMGGASVAFPQDSVVGAVNPAGMYDVGNRYDFGLKLFRPIRSSEIVGNANPSNNHTYDASDNKNFLVPEFGYNKKVNERTTIGVSMFGNGGMNTDYTTPIALFDASGTHTAGVDLAQMFIVPTIAYKFNDKNIIGLGVNLVYQRVKLTGIQNFKYNSLAPSSVSDNDYDDSKGIGFRIGWLSHVSPKFSIGLTYQAKTNMSKLDKYKGVFANHGDFDIPSNYAIGFKFQTDDRTVVAFDVMRINYSESASVGNTKEPSLSKGIKFGANGASGFGWKDQTVFKLGVAYKYTPRLTLRAGFNHGNNPIRSSDTFFNMLAPGVEENHGTLGATLKMKDGSEWTISYMHCFVNTLNGKNSIPASFGGGNANLTMYEDAIGLGYGRIF